MKTRVILTAIALLLLTGCAGSNPLTGSPGSNGVAGFLVGLWHGFICPIAFVIALFDRGISIYEVHNNGAWYNAGFIIGAGAWGMLRGSTGKPLKKYRDDEVLMELRRRGLVPAPGAADAT